MPTNTPTELTPSLKKQPNASQYEINLKKEQLPSELNNNSKQEGESNNNTLDDEENEESNDDEQNMTLTSNQT